MPVFNPTFQRCSSAASITSLSLLFAPSLSPAPSLRFKFTISCCFPAERNITRLGLPSKGRMAADTLDLFRDCQLSVRQVNNRPYVAEIPQLPNVEVWFQRPKDIVWKLVSGDLDLGIVGLDTLSEYGQGNDDLIIVHESLEFGPKHVIYSTADGALEAAPAMGIADVIIDLVTSGITLRENYLKEIEGGVIVESQAVLVANRKSLTQREGVLDITQEILERLEAHSRASGQFTVTANMRGSSAEEVAERVLGQPSLSGLRDPTVSPVYCKRDGRVSVDYYAIVICVPKKMLFESVQQLRVVGCSRVLISPSTYIFDEEPLRWNKLLSKLGL